MNTEVARNEPTASEAGWRLLYRAGGVVALVAVTGMLLDIVLTMIPGWGPETVPATAEAWLAQLAENPLLGLRNLDLLNVVLALISLPMYAALFGAHRKTEPGLAILGLVTVAAGTAVFAANSAALPMLELGRQWASAAPVGQALLEPAAAALLASGAHGSAGAYLGFLVSEIGTLVIAVTMLRGRVFGRKTALTGIVGISILAVYTTAYTFGSGSEALVTGIAIPGGLLMIVWHLLVAKGLGNLGRS